MKKMDAYMTVEAAMVLPIVLAVIVLILYLLFFQYDRCLMEQSAGVLAMRGCTIQAGDQDALAYQLNRECGKIDNTGYLAWDASQAQVSLRGNRVTVRQTGSLRFPFQGFILRYGDEIWTAGREYKNRRIDPMNFIRNCRKGMGGK